MVEGIEFVMVESLESAIEKERMKLNTVEENLYLNIIEESFINPTWRLGCL